MKTIAFSPAAEFDITEIWAYSADLWGPDQADNYVDAIRDVCIALAAGAKGGRPVDVLPDFMKYFCGSHVVYFLDRPTQIDVIRILHQRQDAVRQLGQPAQQNSIQAI